MRHANITKSLILIAAALLIASCSSVNPESPFSYVDSSGRHPDGWETGHGTFALPDASSCFPCHGDDLTGGSTNVGCFLAECHHQYSADWTLPGEHGSSAKAGPDGGSFQSCQICHGSNFDGGAVSISCSGIDCHSAGVPHPSDWWEEGTDLYIHQEDPRTNPANAQVCALCHLGGLDSPLPPPPAPTSLEPGCFNNTLCHSFAHESPFLGHEDQAAAEIDFTTTCSTCHAVTGTSPDDEAPTCVSSSTGCHENGSPYDLTSCSSCHGRPPTSGRHQKHNDASCNDCHQDAGSGSDLNHFYDNEVDVSFSVPSFAYSVGRCTGTCHFDGESEDHSNEKWVKD